MMLRAAAIGASSADDGSDRDQHALDVFQRDPRIARGADVRQVGQRCRAGGGEGGDSRQHQIARLEVAAFERHGGHRGQGVQQWSVVSHRSPPWAIENAARPRRSL